MDGEPESMAELGEVLVNTSSVLGESVSFYCEVIGSQTVGEKLIFSKVKPLIELANSARERTESPRNNYSSIYTLSIYLSIYPSI